MWSPYDGADMLVQQEDVVLEGVYILGTRTRSLQPQIERKRGGWHGAEMTRVLHEPCQNKVKSCPLCHDEVQNRGITMPTSLNHPQGLKKYNPYPRASPFAIPNIAMNGSLD